MIYYLGVYKRDFMVFRTLLSAIFIALVSLLVSVDDVFAKKIHPQAEPINLPLHINIGATVPYTTTDNLVFLPDQPWGPAVQYGYVGGVSLSQSDYWLISGTDNSSIYRTTRRKWQEYKVRDLPEGEYLVTLHFAELFTHGPGLTVFDISIEGQTVLNNFDPFAEVGLDYALERQFTVTVSDGELTLVAQVVSKHSHLAGLSIESIVPDTDAPSVPTGFQAVPSYEATILTWNENGEADIDGYYIYRAADPTGPFVQITQDPVHVMRYIDQYQDIPQPVGVITPTKPSESVWYYQISGVDVYNNQSAATEPLPIQPLSIASIDVPVYELEISPADLEALYSDIWFEDGVNATVFYSGKKYDANVRFRGNFSRGYPKKSWKVVFTDESPYTYRDRLNLKSHYDDYTLMRGALTAAMYEKVGIKPPTTEHAALFINGQYMGLFSDYEQVNDYYMSRTGRNPESTVYEPTWTPYANYGDLLPDIAAYREGYEIKNNDYFGYADLISFIELINNTPEQFFPSRLFDVFEIKRYLDYYAVVILTNNVEFTRHDIRILQDRETNRWEFIPWDPDYTWGYVYPFSTGINGDQPINSGTLANPGLVFHGPNRFLSRVMDVPEYRAYFCERLTEITTDSYVTSNIFPLVDGYHSLIEQETIADWWKAEGAESILFENSANQLKQFVQNRALFLRGEIPAYCIDPRAVLRVNEIMIDNQSTICDEDDPSTLSCHDDWIEIYNPGLTPVDMQGLYLTNDRTNPTKFPIPDSLIVPPMDSILIWADSEEEQGISHTNFSLDLSDSSVSLFAQDGITEISYLDIENLAADQSIGRYPDGADYFYEMEVATPNEANEIGLIFEQVTVEPEAPTSSDAVTVTARFFEDARLETAQLYYNVPNVGWASTQFVRKDNSDYEAVIPPQPDGTFIRYYIRAKSTTGKIISQPQLAPISLFDYLIGYRRPSVIINELVADHDPLIASGSNGTTGSSWFELYNPGNSPVQVEGMYLSDNPNIPRKYRIPSRLLIPARGYMVFYANATSEFSPWHTNFTLDKNGGMLALYDTDLNQNRLIDTHAYNSQPSGRSEQRCYNHLSSWNESETPTPGYLNTPGCVVSYLPFIAEP